MFGIGGCIHDPIGGPDPEVDAPGAEAVVAAAAGTLRFAAGEPSERLLLPDRFNPRASSLLTSSIANRSSLFPDVAVRSKYLATVAQP